MPTYTGKTDEVHVVTLPSAIETVRWSRRQVAPGGVARLEVQTVFCGTGSQIDVELVDARGTSHATLSGELVSTHLSVGLRIPEAAEGAVMAKVQLPNHGLSAESEALPLTAPVRVRGPRWSKETVKRGDVVTVTAEANGAPDGRRARVRIFEQDPDGGAHNPVTRLRPRVEGGAVEGMYQFQYPNETSTIVPEWEASDGYVQPQFFYTVNVSGVIADSQNAKARGLLTFVDDLVVHVVDAKNGGPYPEQEVELTLADGSTKTETTNGSGTVDLNEIPPGPARVKLPDLDVPNEEAEPIEVPAGAREAAARPSPEGAPTATIATGPTCYLWVAHRPAALSV